MKVRRWLTLFQWLETNRVVACEDHYFKHEVWIPVWRSCRAALNLEREDNGPGSLSAEYRDNGKCERKLLAMAESIEWNPDLSSD